MYHIYEQRDVCGRSRIISDVLAKFIIVERDTKEEADTFCESLGMYFNGVVSGIDNGCCGDSYVFLKSSPNITVPDYSRTQQIHWRDAVVAYEGYCTPRVIYRIHNKDGSITSSAEYPVSFSYDELEQELRPYIINEPIQVRPQLRVPRPVPTFDSYVPITASMWANTTTTTTTTEVF